jgi:two-component system, NtrC family, sensor kinase
VAEAAFAVILGGGLAGRSGARARLTSVSERSERDEREAEQQAQRVRVDRLANVGRLASGIGHEINNPLTFVMANLDFVAEELTAWRAASESRPDLEDLLDAVKTAREGVDQIRDIVRDLQGFARSDPDGAPSAVDLRRELDTVARLLRGELRRRAEVVRQYEEIPHVSVQRGALAHVLMTFVSVASRACQMAGGGRTIHLVTRRVGPGEVAVEVRHDGAALWLGDGEAASEGEPREPEAGESVARLVAKGIGGRIEEERAPGSCALRLVLPLEAP